MINQYGILHQLPKAACQPDRNLDYRIVYRISNRSPHMGEPTPGLSHIALTINLFEWAGIPQEHQHLVGVIHGEATSAALKKEVYQKAYNRPHPDTDLIHQLTAHGVILYVCGQSVYDRGFREDQVNPEVIFALSALTVLPTYQLKGYALMHY
jgi:intracellular sulfur oxidation DsrE/DsrF family protein